MAVQILALPRPMLVAHLAALFLDLGLAGIAQGDHASGSADADWKGTIPIDVLWRFLEEVSYKTVPP